SYGFLKHPEALQPGDLRRTTASLHYGAAGDRPLAVTLLWGRNREEHGTTDTLLGEAAYQLTELDQLYGRVERVEKPLELLLTKSLDMASHDGPEPVVPVGLARGRARHLAAAGPGRPVKDPVCGMTVDPRTTSLCHEHEGTTYYFCSESCLQRFRESPRAFLQSAKALEAPAAPGPAGVVYTCPMHPEILRDGPGRCPICGMALEPRTVTLEEGPSPEL